MPAFKYTVYIEAPNKDVADEAFDYMVEQDIELGIIDEKFDVKVSSRHSGMVYAPVLQNSFVVNND